MNEEGHFAVEPWSVREPSLDLSTLASSESVFALSNGHIGLRANLDEGEPYGAPGTYLNAFYERRPLPYAESAYGYPDEGQTHVNVTNGKVMRLLVDDAPFDVRYGKLIRHERVLDFRDGLLRRSVEWRSQAGDLIRLNTARLVSLDHRAIAAIVYEVEPLEEPLRIVVQSELIANEPVPADTDDPRAAAALTSPLVSEQHGNHDLRATLTHRTRASKLLVSVSMDHVVEGPEGTVTDSESEADLARVTVTTELTPGEPLRIVKLLSYGWSSRRSLPALRDQVHASLASAKRTGWDGLCRMQRAYLDDFWAGADVELEGDAPLQQAVRFGLFHALQAGARGQRRAIPAKGLTGTGYDGHTFWDTEMYVLPALTYTAPQAAADALRWRHETLELAKVRAHELGKEGAAFPWRTIHGEECSGYWPAGTAAFHINADIADAVRRLYWATGDDDFMREVGLELLIETARLWRSLGHHEPGGGFRIDGVTGPDEYSALADNNVFTNLMAARNMRTAADVSARFGELAATFGVDNEEIAEWRDAAAAITVPYNDELRVHEQAEDFTHHERWDFDETGEDKYPLLLHYSYYDLYRKQVIKQADLVMALYLHGDRFDPEQKARDFEYYEALTVRDSSLSAAIQAIVAAETGHLELAHDLFGEAALVDLRDLKHNTDDGLHIASLAGGWLVAVAGFGGLRDHDDTLSFAPRLPERLGRLEFRLAFRGRRLSVRVHRNQVRYTLLDGDALELLHHGERVLLSPDAPQTRKVPPGLVRPPITHPRGRAPRRRHPASD